MDVSTKPHGWVHASRFMRAGSAPAPLFQGAIYGTTVMSEEFSTPVQNLVQWSQRYGDKPFLIQPIIDQDHRVYSYKQTWSMVQSVAQGFYLQGIRPGQRIALLSKNCAEWFIVDWAIQLLGAVSVPLYPTQSCASLCSTLTSFPVNLLVIGKLDSPDDYLPLITLGIKTASLPYPNLNTDVSWRQLSHCEPLAETRHHKTQPNDIMTIHFTSGTSGRAKGVELTYQAYHYACRNTKTAMHVTADDRFLSYLPLAHIAERMMIEGNAVFSGATTYFVSSLDNFVADLKYAKPTAFMSVPRLWKNFQTGIHSKLPAPLLQVLLKIPLLSWLVKKLIRKLLGLSYARLTGSGAAVMPVELLKWYEGLGIPISEAWGLTETCGLSSMNYPYHPNKVGTIGQAVTGTEMKLADDGELLVKSAGLFQRYAEDDAATRAAFDNQGFFRTGDMATWQDEQAAWRLIGRKNDTFKTSKGKFVIPTAIETKLTQSDLIEQACVLGEGRKQPIALLQLSASQRASATLSEQLTNELQRVNNLLEKHEQLEAFFISQNLWSPENQLTTPTLKIRRRAIHQTYQRYLPERIEQPIHWLQKI